MDHGWEGREAEKAKESLVVTGVYVLEDQRNIISESKSGYPRISVLYCTD